MITVPNFLENLVRDKTFKFIYSNWKKSITFHYNSLPIFLSIFREVLPWSIFRLWLKQSLLPLIFIKIFRISIQNLTKCPKSMVAIFGSHRHRNFTSLKGTQHRNFWSTFSWEKILYFFIRKYIYILIYWMLLTQKKYHSGQKISLLNENKGLQSCGYFSLE